MAKKKPAEFNMAQSIREILTENPASTSQEMIDAIKKKYPGAKINKNSFGVAFYTGRQKLGIGGKKRRSKRIGIRRSTSGMSIDMAALQAAAKFLREAGGYEAAVEAIKQVQAVQMH